MSSAETMKSLAYAAKAESRVSTDKADYRVSAEERARYEYGRDQDQRGNDGRCVRHAYLTRFDAIARQG
jgi:hypothetical protein